MKPFFFILLIVSIVFPFYSFIAAINDFAHNQYAMRVQRLEGTTPMKGPGAHLGLMPAQLSGLDELVVAAYADAVHDGYKLGRGYHKLWFQSLALDVLLFTASVVGLVGARRRKVTPDCTGRLPLDDKGLVP